MESKSTGCTRRTRLQVYEVLARDKGWRGGRVQAAGLKGRGKKAPEDK